MSRTYVYVIVASEADYFAEMAAVSMASLRHVHPDAHISVVCDEGTLQQATPGVRLVKNLANQIIAVPVEFDNPTLLSRSMKTRMRELVRGDFLFLDSDTFVLRKLDGIWTVPGDIAAAPDLDASGRPYLMTPAQQANFRKMEWPDLSDTHLNAGVLLIRDNPATQTFSAQFQEDWKNYRTVTGAPNDQPVFNHTVRTVALAVNRLPLRYNAQIVSNPMAGRRAAVAHVFSGQFETRTDTVLHIASRQLKQDGRIDMTMVQNAIEAGHVWTKLDSPKKCLAAGSYTKALQMSVRKLVKRDAR